MSLLVNGIDLQKLAEQIAVDAKMVSSYLENFGNEDTSGSTALFKLQQISDQLEKINNSFVRAFIGGSSICVSTDEEFGDLVKKCNTKTIVLNGDEVGLLKNIFIDECIIKK